jgi:hypothetical protein
VGYRELNDKYIGGYLPYINEVDGFSNWDTIYIEEGNVMDATNQSDFMIHSRFYGCNKAIYDYENTQVLNQVIKH